MMRVRESKSKLGRGIVIKSAPKASENYWLSFNQANAVWELRSEKEGVIYSSKFRDDIVEKFRENVEEVKGLVTLNEQPAKPIT